MKKIAHRLKAVSDETRLRLLALLAGGELCVCELMTVLELPQSTVSRHLAYLRNAGLVEDRRQGVWMYYRLVEGAEPFTAALLAFIDGQLRDNPRALRDRQALAAYRAGKTPARCD